MKLKLRWTPAKLTLWHRFKLFIFGPFGRIHFGRKR